MTEPYESSTLSRRGFLRLIGITSAVVAVPSLWLPEPQKIVPVVWHGSAKGKPIHLDAVFDAIGSPYEGYAVLFDHRTMEGLAWPTRQKIR